MCKTCEEPLKAAKQRWLKLLDTIVDIETVLKYKMPSTQNHIRAKTVDIFDTKNGTQSY